MERPIYDYKETFFKLKFQKADLQNMYLWKQWYGRLIVMLMHFVNGHIQIFIFDSNNMCGAFCSEPILNYS